MSEAEKLAGLLGPNQSSKTPANLEIDGWVAEACVVDIGGEFGVFMREADQETALNVELSLKRHGMLGRQADMQPAGWRVGQFRSAVVKASVASGCVEHVFVRNQQLEFPVTE